MILWSWLLDAQDSTLLRGRVPTYPVSQTSFASRAHANAGSCSPRQEHTSITMEKGHALAKQPTCSLVCLVSTSKPASIFHHLHPTRCPTGCIAAQHSARVVAHAKCLLPQSKVKACIRVIHPFTITSQCHNPAIPQPASGSAPAPAPASATREGSNSPTRSRLQATPAVAHTIAPLPLLGVQVTQGPAAVLAKSSIAWTSWAKEASQSREHQSIWH